MNGSNGSKEPDASKQNAQPPPAAPNEAPPEAATTPTTANITASATATTTDAPPTEAPKAASVTNVAIADSTSAAPPVKRGRGRPRKHPLGYKKAARAKAATTKAAKAAAAKAAAASSSTATATAVSRTNAMKLPMHNKVTTTSPTKRGRSGSFHAAGGASVGGAASVTDQDINDVMGMDTLDSDSAFAASLLLSPQLSPGFTAELGFSRGGANDKSWMASPSLPENDLLDDEGGDSASWNRPAPGSYIPPATGFPMPNLEGTSLTNHHSPSKKVRTLSSDELLFDDCRS